MKIINELIPYIIIVAVVILIRTYIATPVIVDGTSMNKTLNDNDVVVLCKVCKYDRDSIVVLNESDDGERIIKRVIALPGESISIKKGKSYVNDKLYEDTHAYGDTSDYEKITLKEDEYFVLGDNRLVSKDSRYFGPVKKEYIQGTAIFRFYPFNKIGSI